MRPCAQRRVRCAHSRARAEALPPPRAQLVELCKSAMTDGRIDWTEVVDAITASAQEVPPGPFAGLLPWVAGVELKEARTPLEAHLRTLPAWKAFKKAE